MNIELVARVFIFIPVSFVCVFVIPNFVDKDIFLKTISLVSASIALIGIPSSITGITFSYVTTHRSATIFGFDFFVMESIFNNPNPLGFLLFYGVIAGFVWDKNKSLRYILVGISTVGLFLTQSRAAFLAAFASFSIYIIGKSIAQKHFYKVIELCLLVGTVGLLMFMRLIPPLSVIEQISLSGRTEIWDAAISAARARPIVGHGPGDVSVIVSQFSDRWSVGAGVYNMFLRLFITTGVFGGLCYAYIFIYSIVNHSKCDLNHHSLIVYALVIGFVVNDVFSGNTIFGLSTASIVGAILIGYSLSDIVSEYSNENLPY